VQVGELVVADICEVLSLGSIDKADEYIHAYVDIFYLNITIGGHAALI